MTRQELAGLIDHTYLHPVGEARALTRLCREAACEHFASVMVSPTLVKAAAGLLQGSGVRVGTVIGFPSGAHSSEVKNHEALSAIDDGALDLDFVVDIARLKAAAKSAAARRELLLELKVTNLLVKEATFGVVTKLILECCYLTAAEKRLGAQLAARAGFDFVKTSTGFGPGGATVADVRLLKRAAGRKTLVKAAGGIRTLAAAEALLKAGADRLGCSASMAILKELKERG